MGLPMRLSLKPNAFMLCGFIFFIYVWVIFSRDPTDQLYHHGAQFVDLKRLLIASVIAAEKGGNEVIKARDNPLKIQVKGKTKEGVLDVLTEADRNSNYEMVSSLSFTFPGLKIISEEKLPFMTGMLEPLTIDPKLFADQQFATIPDDILLSLKDLTVWIDPLDATKEYSEGLTNYVTTMVCVASNGRPILGVIHQPYLKQTYWATKFGIDKKLLKLRSKFSKTINETVRFVVSRSHKGNVLEHLQQTFKHKFAVQEAAGSGYKTLELFHARSDIYLHTTHIKKWDICAPHALIKYASDGDLETLSGEPIDYSDHSSALNPNGVFATLKSDFMKYRHNLL